VMWVGMRSWVSDGLLVFGEDFMGLLCVEMDVWSYFIILS
jgi:hypothetical protein